jgi:hypothetical protein
VAWLIHRLKVGPICPTPIALARKPGLSHVRASRGMSVDKNALVIGRALNRLPFAHVRSSIFKGYNPAGAASLLNAAATRLVQRQRRAAEG